MFLLYKSSHATWCLVSPGVCQMLERWFWLEPYYFSFVIMVLLLFILFLEALSLSPRLGYRLHTDIHIWKLEPSAPASAQPRQSSLCCKILGWTCVNNLSPFSLTTSLDFKILGWFQYPKAILFHYLNYFGAHLVIAASMYVMWSCSLLTGSWTSFNCSYLNLL